MFDLPCLLTLASEVKDLLMQATCREREEVEVQAALIARSICWQQRSFGTPSDAVFLYSSPELWYCDGHGFLVKAAARQSLI